MRALLIVLMATLLCASAQGAALLSKVSVPSDSVIVMAVSQAVHDDIDTGGYGPWAIDDYTILTAVWKRPDGTYFALITHAGNWQVIANFEQMQFSAPGTYSFLLSLDGVSLGSRTLEVKPIFSPSSGHKTAIA